MKSRKVWLVLGALLLVGVGGAAALLLANRRDVTTTSRAAYEAYQEAVRNENCFYMKEARLGYAKALELDPAFAMAMLGMARQSGNEEKAIAFIKRAARERDHLTERERYWVDIGLAGMDKKHEEVQRLAGELRAKYPEDGRAVSILAHGAIARGETDRAIQIFEELLQIDPNNAEAYNQIGYYHGYRGDYEKAMAALRKYQFIAADQANPFDSLGENQAYAGHYPEAIENLNRALAIKADFFPAYWHLGVVYEGLGQYGKAIEAYEKAADLVDRPDGRREFCFAALRAASVARDVASARRIAGELDKLPKDKYSSLQSMWTAAILDLLEGRAADAERRMREIRPSLEEEYAKALGPGSKRKPHYADWNLVMALALEKQGKTDEALELWQINANPPNPYRNFEERRAIYEARAAVAVILAKKGKLDEAEKLIAENRKWNPSWAPTREAETTVAELRREKVLAASASR